MKILSTAAAPNTHVDQQVPPHDGSHPVRLVLLVEVFALLDAYGYRRPSMARSTARSLQLLNELTTAFEAGR